MEYKVIALSVGGLGNKIFKAGDVVTERNFPEGNAAELVEKGFLSPIEDRPQIQFDKVAEKIPDKPPAKRGRRRKSKGGS